MSENDTTLFGEFVREDCVIVVVVMMAVMFVLFVLFVMMPVTVVEVIAVFMFYAGVGADLSARGADKDCYQCYHQQRYGVRECAA